MLTYDFEQVKGPLYAHIYNCIKQDILQGKLQSGQKLPSKRSFAKNNGISTITIQNAYDQLMSEGYIYALPKKGYYVSEIDTEVSNKRQPAVELDIHIPQQDTSVQFDFSSNTVDADNFPFSIWAKLIRECNCSKKRFASQYFLRPRKECRRA